MLLLGSYENSIYLYVLEAFDVGGLPFALSVLAQHQAVLMSKQKKEKQMKALSLALGVVVFSLTSAMAQAVPFMSGSDDNCVGCSLSGQIDPYYFDPVGSDLDGAIWIQDTAAWNVNNAGYRVWETDLNQTGTASIIDSLFVSYDDTLMIKSQGVTLFDSGDYSISSPWTQQIDVMALVGSPFLIAGNGRLNFWVTNSADHATGVIWKGSTAVPEPGTLALLGLGIAGLGVARRKAKAA